MNLFRRPLFLLLLAILFAWTSAHAFNQDSVVNPNSPLNTNSAVDISKAEVIPLDKGQLRVYRDKTNTLTLDQIRSAAIQKEFVQLDKNLGFGYVPDTFWLSFTIDKQEAQSSAWLLEVLPPYLDHIQLFHIDPTGYIATSQDGDFVPFSQKQEAHRGALFKLNLQAGHHEFYLRLKTSSTMTAIVKLWQPEAFSKHVRSSYFVFGLYFSLILAVFLFTLVSLLVVKQRIFFYYSLYLLLGMTQWLTASGFTGEFIFPEQPLYSNLTLGISLSLAAAMAYLFYGKVYELRRYHPRIFILYGVGVVSALAAAIAVPFGLYQTLAPIMLIIAVLAILTSPWPLLRLWRSHELWKRVVVLAYSVFSVLMMISILSSLSVIGFSEKTLYTGMLSSLCHILLLHFALMLQSRDESEAARRAMLATEIAQREVEQEKRQGQQQKHFLTMMSHEIRTPIALIDSARQVLEALDEDKCVSPDPQRQRRYATIKRAVSRLGALMDMALTRVNDIPEVWELLKLPINPKVLTDQVLDTLEPAVSARIHISADAQLPELFGDERLLRIALLNLLENAGKYAPGESPINVKLQVCSHENASGVRWHIEDGGPGVPSGMEERIFERYTRLGEISGTAGLGLGLHLVRQIVEHHGGTVSAETGRSLGAGFIVWLPTYDTKEIL